MTGIPDGEASEQDSQRPADEAEEKQDDTAPKDAQTLGREFSNRAAQPGGTEERLSAERDARTNLAFARVTAGKVVGGDEINYITVTSGGTPLRLVELTAEDVWLNESFVQPPGFDLAESEARARAVLIIRGAAASGRFALSRHLLLDLTAGSVRRLHPETDLSLLAADDLEPGGYLLADLEPHRAARLRAFDLDRLAAELAPGHKLIVTITGEVRFHEADIERYVVETESPPPDQVLKAHLKRLLGSAERVAAILRDDDVRALCQEELRTAVPGHVVTLATLIAKAPVPIAESVRQGLEVKTRPDLESWFSKLPDLQTQTLAVGIAVLGGESYELVASAAETLCKQLEPPNPPPKAASPFGPTRGSRLALLNAHLVPSNLAARHGGTMPGEVIRYREPARSQQVLLHVWNEYDEIRPELLTWLRSCARHEVPTVRVRAAVAAGLLATRAFDHIRSAIILPWARADRPELRDVAAAALGVTADSRELRQAVRNLVSAWSADGSNPRLQATAARSWRVQTDPRDCVRAVALLDELSGSQEPVVIEALCESVTEMLEFEASAFAAEGLTLLRNWLAGRNADRQVLAKLAFVLAAADLVRELPDGTWPTLLDIAEHDAERAPAIAHLWSAVLNSADLHQVAKEVLAEWARFADASLKAARALGRLLAAAATTSRTMRIIEIEATRWTRAPRSRTAVLDILRSERNPR
ncbi:hypothetical protein ACIBHY_51410 [Nonomuraea sp. NPDC050547]|uniref:hypothetical protein n=1 Tax=Nonomuraea sp. NPDC050547 TaxID=3364368 RepID=UPI0037B2DA8E